MNTTTGPVDPFYADPNYILAISLSSAVLLYPAFFLSVISCRAKGNKLGNNKLALMLFLAMGDMASDIYYIITQRYCRPWWRWVSIGLLALPALSCFILLGKDSIRNVRAMSATIAYRPKRLDECHKIVLLLFNRVIQCVLLPLVYIVALSFVINFKMAAFPQVSKFFFTDQSYAFNVGILSELFGESAPQIAMMTLNSQCTVSTPTVFYISLGFSVTVFLKSVWPILYSVFFDEDGLSHKIYVDFEWAPEELKAVSDAVSWLETFGGGDDDQSRSEQDAQQV